MSKFKISPAGPTVPDKSMSRDDFVAGAAMVKSQTGHRPVKPVRLNLDLDPDLHRRLKMRAVETDVTIAELVRGLITRELG